ncbi:BTAD domain-containing putative transcriptional regulator [Saccharothrix obliqua]|uniref:BTAD domain-containing putative transcriptional regulator n=1 Tax=Saccharothrix obliqua TaxID=2861747 RepID=UPI001C5E143A|nr:BTAD domain-containing putative transcriptional regulator [Saccharothrix obliqua]MBW4718276.1 winged helix-turn-helix domain-containing protein [Saccharothrix obliqua]
MRVGVLGPLTVDDGDGHAVGIGGTRVRALLVRLALAAGRVVTVEELAAALWPDDKPADEVGAARSLVSRLRRSLPDPAALRSAHGGYLLDVPPDAVDAHRFDRLARDARHALAAGDHRAARRLAREALDLWRGPALADVAGLPFAVGHLAGLEEARLAAAEDAAEAGLACGEGRQVVAELTDLAARHPLRERLQALLLRALFAAGRPAEALAGYEEVRRRLADELGADPGPELRAAHEHVLRAEAPEPHRTGNLRVPLTSFLGRADDLDRVEGLLARHRLVTLVGPGGAGKTRLATTAAARLPRGAWLVELAPVTDPADVAPAVLGALGLRDQRTVDRPVGRWDAVGLLVETLSRTETLLVLDNCEHVVDAAARLAEELLGRCPALRVLATSREPLGVLGEAILPVPPLDVDTAVRLLAERAAAVRPGFEVTDANTPVLVEVCRRLDGLPLAIELAAARLRSLTPEQLAARLDDRFRLLTGGSRTAMPRHRTLRAVVAWSWDLLDDAERDFAERLAVFPAGVDLEAAEHLVGEDAFDLLTALVDKSLLHVVSGGRHRMLETIREYGLERLAERGLMRAARAEHARYYRDLAERAEPHVRGKEQLTWLARLDAERDNVLAALHFAADDGDADTAMRIAAAMSMFWTVRGNRSESVNWFRLALGVPGEAPPVARLVVSTFLLLNDAIATGFRNMEQHVVVVRGLLVGVDRQHPMAVLVEPMTALFLDDSDRALADVAARLDHPDPWTRAMLRVVAGAARENVGDMRGAREDLETAIAGFREVGDRFGLSQALTAVAEAHLAFGRPELAVAALEESVALLREVDDTDDATHERILLVHARIQLGELARAEEECRVLTRPLPGPWSSRSEAFARVVLGDLARRRGDLAEAARQYETAAVVLDQAPFVVAQFSAVLLAARAHLATARGEDAAHLVREAAEHAVRGRDMPVLARVAVAAADLHLLRGDSTAAAKALGAAERLRGAPDPLNPEVVRVADALRADLGAAAYDLAYASGVALDPADAVAAAIPD